VKNPRDVYEEFARRARESFGKESKAGQSPLTDLIKHPAEPFDKAPPVLRTLVTITGLISVAALAGMGFVALSLLVLCTLLLFMILKNVLGIDLEFDAGEFFF